MKNLLRLFAVFSLSCFMLSAVAMAEDETAAAVSSGSSESAATSSAASSIQASSSNNQDSSASQAALGKPDKKLVLPEWHAESMADPISSVWPMFRGLGLCLGVFFILVFVYKRLRGPAAFVNKRGLRMIERLSLTPKTMLCLVDVAGQQVLLSVGADRVSLLSDPVCRLLNESDLDQAAKDLSQTTEKAPQDGGSKA